jgi:hypothetical protein
VRESGVVVLVVGADEFRSSRAPTRQFPQRRFAAVVRGVGIEQQIQ